MRMWSVLVAVMVLAIGASLAMAQEAQKGKNRGGVRGKITKIDGANITIQTIVREGSDAKPETKTFATDDKTALTAGTREGDKKTAKDLKEGDTIMVRLSEDGKTAVNVVINPTLGGGGGGAGGKGGGKGGKN